MKQLTVTLPHLVCVSFHLSPRSRCVRHVAARCRRWCTTTFRARPTRSCTGPVARRGRGAAARPSRSSARQTQTRTCGTAILLNSFPPNALMHGTDKVFFFPNTQCFVRSGGALSVAPPLETRHFRSHKYTYTALVLILRSTALRALQWACPWSPFLKRNAWRSGLAHALPLRNSVCGEKTGKQITPLRSIQSIPSTHPSLSFKAAREIDASLFTV